MNTPFPLARIGEVCRLVTRPEVPTPGMTYRLIGVRLWGQGAYERESIDGAGTKYSTLSRLNTGDVVVNKIWARNGSVGVISEELDGCYGSNEFPIFAPDESRVLPRWIHWLTKTEHFWSQCADKSRGTSGQNRIRPERFMEINIPLPPLDEQRRIVAKIEELAGKIEEARRLRQEAEAERNGLLAAVLRHIFERGDSGQAVPLETVCEAIIDNLHSNPVYSDWGVPCVRSSDVTWGHLHLDTARRTTEAEYVRRTARGIPRVDDIILVREGGGTGKAAIVEDGQRFSLGQRVMMLRPNRCKILPKYLLYQLMSPTVYVDQVLAHCKGSASPHLNIGLLRKFCLNVPSLADQSAAVTQLDNLTRRHGMLQDAGMAIDQDLSKLYAVLLDGAVTGNS